MQKPETGSLCAGNILLTAFHSSSCQVTGSTHSQAPACWKLKSFPLQKQPILLCEVPSSWSECLSGSLFGDKLYKGIKQKPHS